MNPDRRPDGRAPTTTASPASARRTGEGRAADSPRPPWLLRARAAAGVDAVALREQVADLAPSWSRHAYATLADEPDPLDAEPLEADPLDAEPLDEEPADPPEPPDDESPPPPVEVPPEPPDDEAPDVASDPPPAAPARESVR